MIYTPAILIGHFVADFVCQPRSWATKKHEDVTPLIYHVSLYMFMMAVAFGVVAVGKIPLTLVVLWTLMNGVMHFIVDFVTSKLVHKYSQEGKIGTAIKIIGLDQLLHYLCLFGTLGIMP